MSFNMYVPTRTLFGSGQLNKLKDQVMPGKKAIIVISKGKSTRTNGYLDRVEKQLNLAGVERVVFDKVEPNPLKSTVMLGSTFARENGCDFVVALGGGSCIDAAKAIAVMAVNSGDLWDYIQSGTGKRKAIENKPLPIAAITTTAGTGSETDAGAAITNEETREKSGIKDPALFPVLAIADPELMKSVPAKFTAFQGWDALSHSMEGYINNKTSLMSDMYAITAIENVSHYLARAVKNGDDMEARERVAFGSNLSGVVMCVGATSSQHSLETALSAYYQDLPHGAGLIMLSKAYFTHFINKHVCDERFIRMAKVMGMKEAKEPMDFITALIKLQKECGVADLKMSDYGIKPEEFETMAYNAKNVMGGLFMCDRSELTIEDCVEIYKESYR